MWYWPNLSTNFVIQFSDPHKRGKEKEKKEGRKRRGVADVGGRKEKKGKARKPGG